MYAYFVYLYFRYFYTIYFYINFFKISKLKFDSQGLESLDKAIPVNQTTELNNGLSALHHDPLSAISSTSSNHSPADQCGQLNTVVSMPTTTTHTTTHATTHATAATHQPSSLQLTGHLAYVSPVSVQPHPHTATAPKNTPPLLPLSAPEDSNHSPVNQNDDSDQIGIADVDELQVIIIMIIFLL